MCGKILKQAIIAICLSLGLSSCCVQVSADGGSTPTAVPQQTITMSRTQWETLRQELSEQDQDLQMLREKLKMLKSNSTEQMKQLEILQNQLSEMRKSLTGARTSLIDAQNALNESKKSLEKLKAEIKRMEHKQVVLRRQRDIYAGIAVVAVGAAIARR